MKIIDQGGGRREEEEEEVGLQMMNIAAFQPPLVGFCCVETFLLVSLSC
jgi:hypothetical protein